MVVMRKVAITAAAAITSLLSFTAVPAEAATTAVTVSHWGSFFGDSNASDRDVTLKPATVTIADSSPVVQVGSSNSTQYALLADGTLWAWGQGTNGQLGNGADANSFGSAVEVQFPQGTLIANIPADAMPYDTALAVDTAGNVWGWGLNKGGELCLGNTTGSDMPQELPLTAPVTTLAGANEHAVYDANGTVYSCGANTQGVLGAGHRAASLTPVAVKGLPAGVPVSQLYSAFDNAGALLSSGAYYDWGTDVAGQLGNGTVDDSAYTPVQVTFPQDTTTGVVTQIAQGGSAAGNGQTLAMLADGTLWAWGSDASSQLGDGGTSYQTSPELITPPANTTYATLASGGSTSYAIDTSGDVWAWGAGSRGQIGNGTKTTTAASPVLVASGADMISSTAQDVVIGTNPAQPAAADWPDYLYDTGHSSFNAAATSITPSNAASLKQAWKWPIPASTNDGSASFYASPTVVDGVVYIGAEDGYFYAISEATQTVLWSRFLGLDEPKSGSCINHAQGIISTADVAFDPSTGVETVFVNAPDGNLYALNAQTGATIWTGQVDTPSSTKNDYYSWSSPLVAGGEVYVGISSDSDCPLVPGGVVAFNQSTGAQTGKWISVPTNEGSKEYGASVWSTPVLLANGDIAASTGNGYYGSGQPLYDESIVALTPGTLQVAGYWQIPQDQQIKDGDFGGSPSTWTATINDTPTPMVGACNKDGTFYAFTQASLTSGGEASPAWQDQITVPYPGGAKECDSAAVVDGSQLIIGGGAPTTIGNTTYQGSVQSVNPATGAVNWQTGTDGTIVGTPTEDGGGVVAAQTFQSSTKTLGVYLLDASTGAQVRFLATHGSLFAQPVFAGSDLLIAGGSRFGLQAFAVPSGSG